MVPPGPIHYYVSSCIQCIHGLMCRDRTRLRTSPRSRAIVTPALPSAWYLVGSAGVLPQSDTETFLWAKKTVEGDLAKAMYAVGTFLKWESAHLQIPNCACKVAQLKRGH